MILSEGFGTLPFQTAIDSFFKIFHVGLGQGSLLISKLEFFFIKADFRELVFYK